MRHAVPRILLMSLSLLPVLGASGVGAVEQHGAPHTNSIGMQFVLIPAGTFQMGCASATEQCDGDEKPRHAVTISKPFYLGKYEVTQAQWEAVMGNNPSKFKGADRPVEQVSWEDVQEFIKKLNAKEGHNRYRLPTEAEWEYAARAGTTTAYSFGDNPRWLTKYAWYTETTRKMKSTQPVGRTRANLWGLYDMYGNVFEWVQDWYDKEGYDPGAVVDPRGPATGEDRAMRGGGWHSTAAECRSGYRDNDSPDYRSSDTGFRLALTPEQ